MSATDTGGRYNRIVFAAPSTCDRRKELRIHSSFDEGANWTGTAGSLLVWGQDAAYSDMVQLSQSSVGVLFEAGPGTPRERHDPLRRGHRRRPRRPGVRRRLRASSTRRRSARRARCTCRTTLPTARTASRDEEHVRRDGHRRRRRTWRSRGRRGPTDSGSFSYFAGPVSAAAAGKCVKWGGAADGQAYTASSSTAADPPAGDPPPGRVPPHRPRRPAPSSGRRGGFRSR